MDWSWYRLENLTKVILVTYPDSFRLEEAKSLVESLPHYKIVKVFTQKYLDHAEYGLGSGKATHGYLLSFTPSLRGWDVAGKGP